MHNPHFFFFLFLSLNYREEAVAPKTEKKKMNV